MPSQKNTTAQSASSGAAQTTINNNSVSQRTRTALLKANLKKFWWLLPLLGLILTIGGISVMRLLPRTKSETQSLTNYLPVAVTEASLEPLNPHSAPRNVALGYH